MERYTIDTINNITYFDYEDLDYLLFTDIEKGNELVTTLPEDYLLGVF